LIQQDRGPLPGRCEKKDEMARTKKERWGEAVLAQTRKKEK